MFDTDGSRLLLDGAMGTEVGRRNLSEADYRGDRFCNHRVALAGCCEVLCLSRPELIAEIHRNYIDTGADIIRTCTFCAQHSWLQRYGLSAADAEDINRAAVQIARRCAEDYCDRRIYIAGSMGPTAFLLSKDMSLYQTVRGDYGSQAKALISEGVDMLAIETCADSMNARAAIDASLEAMQYCGRTLPIWVSMTVNSADGRLSGEEYIIDFVQAIAETPVSVIGLNCGSGFDALAESLDILSACTTKPLILYPNAGLPDSDGKYPETPGAFAEKMKALLKTDRVKIIGGCCGTTPAHILALHKLIENI